MARSYLSSRDPPLRVTRFAVHCGAGEWPLRGAAPRATWLAPCGIKPRPRSFLWDRRPHNLGKEPGECGSCIHGTLRESGLFGLKTALTVVGRWVRC